MVLIALPNTRHADRINERFFHFLCPAVACIVGYIIAMTTKTTVPRYLSMFLMTSEWNQNPNHYHTLILALAGYASGFVMLGWISSTIARPPAKRVAAIGIVNSMGNIGSIPGSHIFPAKYGPYYVKSFGSVLAVLSMACVLAFTLRVHLKYLNEKLEEEEEEEHTTTSNETESIQMLWVLKLDFTFK